MDWVQTIRDVNLENLSVKSFKYEEEIRNRVKQTPLIIFKHQELTNKELLHFVSVLGTPWDNSTFSGNLQTSLKYEIEDESVEIVSHDGILKNREVPWHLDLTHYPTQNIPNRLLYAFENINKTPTIFFNTSLALQKRPDIIANLKYKYVYHKATYSTPWNWPIKRPCIQRHPYHDYWSLLVNKSFCIEKDWFTRKWFDELIEDIWDDDLMYEHTYEKGDLVVYDNLSLLHRRPSFKKGPRRLKRATWEPYWY